MVVMAKTADIPKSRRNPFAEPDEVWDVFIAYLRDAPHRTCTSFSLPFGHRVIVGRGNGAGLDASDERRAKALNNPRWLNGGCLPQQLESFATI